MIVQRALQSSCRSVHTFVCRPIHAGCLYFTVVLLYVSGVKTPPVLEKKPSPRRVPYSSRSAYNSAGRKIKGRGAVVSLFCIFTCAEVNVIIIVIIVQLCR